MGDSRDAARRTLREAADDRRSGAAEIAARAAEALAALGPGDLEDAVLTLVRAHPSMAPLWRLGSAVLAAADRRTAAAGFARELREEPRRVAAIAAPLLPGVVVTLSLSGTVIETLAAAAPRTLCARSEPGGEGARTAERLGQLGLDARLVPDDRAIDAAAAGTAVVVGADAVGPGGVINKIGTSALAEAAGRGGAPCVALAGGSKLVAADLPIAGLFERTPLDRFTWIVTDERALSPDDARAATATAVLDARVARLLAR